MPSVLTARRRAAAAVVAVLTTGALAGCSAGQLNQQQKERAVADAGYATRNGMSVQAVFVDGPVTEGGLAYGHFVAINSGPAADVLTGVTTSLGSGTLLSGIPGASTGSTPTAVPSGSPVPTFSASTAPRTSGPLDSVVVPGAQGRAAANWFVIGSASAAQLVGSTITVTFTFAQAGAIEVSAAVVPGTPGSYTDDTQEQRGQSLGLIGPNGQGYNQLEQLARASESAAAAEEASQAAEAAAQAAASRSASAASATSSAQASATPTP